MKIHFNQVQPFLLPLGIEHYRLLMPELDDQIRNLCTLIGQSEGADYHALLGDLKLLLQQHSLKLENLVAATILKIDLSQSGAESSQVHIYAKPKVA